MAQQFLDLTGLNTFWGKIKSYVADNYVKKEDGKGLSSNDYTTADKGKLAGIETGAQVNVITGIKMQGATSNLTPSSKVVTIPVDSSLNSTSINPIQTKVVHTAIAALAAAVDNSVQSVAGDGYISATLAAVGTGDKDGQKLTIAAQDTLTSAVDKANSALQKEDITTGATNGTIKVDGTEVAVKGLGSAAYKATSYFATAGSVTDLTTRVTALDNATDGRVTVLEGKVNSLSSATHFIGVVDTLPTTAAAGDVCIKGNKEYIWDATANNVNGKAGWVELGDTTAEVARIKAIEDSYVSTFGGKKGVITLDTDASGAGNVKFAMPNNELQATVNVGVTTVGGQSGAITLNSGSTTVGAVNFSMSGNKLTGTVVPQTLPTGSDLVTVTDSTTIDFSSTTSGNKISISGSVKTAGLNDYVDGRIDTKINALSVSAPTAGTGNVTNVVTGVTQTAGKISPVYTSFSAIPTATIEALS